MSQQIEQSTPKLGGTAWWEGLSADEKEDVVGPRLDLGQSCGKIADDLKIGKRNKVVTVRLRIKKKREEKGETMDTWNKSTSSESKPKKSKTRAPRTQQPKAVARNKPYGHFRPPTQYRGSNLPRPRSKPKKEPEAEKEIEAPKSLDIPLMELHDGMCHWPTNMAKVQLYCGTPTDNRHERYCKYHKRQ